MEGQGGRKMNTLMKYDLATLIRAVEEKKKIQDHKGFELPTEVWGEVMSYFQKPIDKYLEKLSLVNLHKTLGAVYRRKMVPWTKSTKYSLEKRREMVMGNIHKYHRTKQNGFKILTNYIQREFEKPKPVAHEYKVGDIFELNKRDERVPYSPLICFVEKVNVKSYRVGVYLSETINSDYQTVTRRINFDYLHEVKTIVKTSSNIKSAVVLERSGENYNDILGQRIYTLRPLN